MKRNLLAVAVLLITAPAYTQNTTTMSLNADAVAAGTLSGAWRVENDAIIGLAEAGQTAWLRLPGTFWDFALELEFMTPAPANGGVQIRGHWLPAAPADGPDPKTMYGYHVTINTLPSGWYRGHIVVTPGRARHVFADSTGKVLFDPTYVRDSAEFQKTNKGRAPNFWRTDRGKITLQAMSGSVAFRNLKIRETK